MERTDFGARLSLQNFYISGRKATGNLHSCTYCRRGHTASGGNAKRRKASARIRRWTKGRSESATFRRDRPCPRLATATSAPRANPSPPPSPSVARCLLRAVPRAGRRARSRRHDGAEDARRDHRDRRETRRERAEGARVDHDDRYRETRHHQVWRRRRAVPVGPRAEPARRIVVRAHVSALLHPRPWQYRFRPERIAARVARLRRRRAGKPDPQRLPDLRHRPGRSAARPAGHAVRPQHAGRRGQARFEEADGRNRRLLST